MKLVKMSLLAATLIASSAFAIENVKVSGDAKLFYGTDDQTPNDLFSQENSYGEAALSLGVTADLTENVSGGATLYAISTMGLENNIVSGTFTGGTASNFWFGEAWLAGTMGNTTAKVGRMALDTPLVFTETWSVVPNTFEAGVLINQDIPDTTIVGAYVGSSSDMVVDGVPNGFGEEGTDAIPGALAMDDIFQPFYQGAYTVGAVNNSWKPLTVQAWYYNAQSVVSAYWAQADLALDMGVTAGLQVTGLNTKEATYGQDGSNMAVAAKVGYEQADVFAVSGAFSVVGEDTDNNAGAGYNLAGSGQSKLYTEAWWGYGYIAQNDTTAINVTATTAEALTWAQLGLYLTQATQTDGNVDGTDLEFMEVTVEAAKSFGPLDVGLYYILTDADDQNAGDAYNSVQAYLTYNF